MFEDTDPEQALMEWLWGDDYDPFPYHPNAETREV